MRDALNRPESVSVEEWLADVANRLLNGVRLMASGEPHRLIEVEAYYHSGDHSDPFAHRDPVQLERGRWYFHRTRGVYRAGSFKGIDLTFGDETAHGGFLFRGLECADGTLIDGPSLLVDHLLTMTGKRDVATLDHAISGRPAWDADSPLYLKEIPDEGRRLYKSIRVGLSLKRQKPTAVNAGFLLKNYRYLSEPGRTAKGKVHVVLALHRLGRSVEEIREVTGCPPATIKRYIEDYEAGTKESDLSVYGGVDLGPRELCRLHGFGLK